MIDHWVMMIQQYLMICDNEYEGKCNKLKTERNMMKEMYTIVEIILVE